MVLSALSMFSGRGADKPPRGQDCDQVTHYAASPSFTHVDQNKMSGHSTSGWRHAPKVRATGKQHNSKFKVI